MSAQEEQVADLNSSNIAATCRQLRDYVQFELSAQPRVGLSFFSADYFQVLDRVFGDASGADGSKTGTGGTAASASSAAAGAGASSTVAAPARLARTTSGPLPQGHRNWLKATVTYPTAGGARPEPGTLRGMQLSKPAAELVRLLALANDDGSSLVAVVRNWRYSRARLPIGLLPIRSQQKLLSAPEYNYVRSSNCDELYDSLLYVKRYEQRLAGPQSTLDVTVFEYYCLLFARYPTMIDSPYTGKPGPSVGSVSSVMAIGLPGDDIRSEGGAVGAPPKNPVETLYNVGPTGWMKGNPYMVLVGDYLSFYFPGDGSLREDSILFLRILIEMWLEQCSIIRFDATQSSSTFDGPPHSSSRRSSGYSPKKLTHGGAGPYSQMRSTHPYGAQSALAQRPSVDSVQFLGSTTPPWTAYTLQCVYLLCDWILRSDAYLNAMYQAALEALSGPDVHDQYQMLLNKRAGRSGAAALIGTSHIEAVERSGTSPRARRDSVVAAGVPFFGLEAVPTALMLQQPVFDMLRTVFFRREQTSWVAFALAVETWLLWLEPDRAVDHSSAAQSGSGRTSPFVQRSSLPQHSSTLPVLWRRHVIDNYLFYAQLPILFFKAAAELDFSSNSESNYYLSLVEAVVDVFTPQVSALLERCHRCLESLRSETQSRSRANSSSAAYARDVSSVPDLTHDEAAALVAHTQRALRNESDAFVKDLRLQAWRQYGIACYRQLFTHAHKAKKAVWGSHDRSERIYKLAERVAQLFEIPPEAVRSVQAAESAQDTAPVESNQFIESLKYLGVLPEDAGIVVSAPDVRPDTDEFGQLTEQGRQQLLYGVRQFRPSNIGTFHRRDVMLYPIYSVEIPWLARMLVKASKLLNHYFNLPRDDRTVTYTWDRQIQLYMHDASTILSTFRFNLRIFADWRVLVAMFALWLFLMM